MPTDNPFERDQEARLAFRVKRWLDIYSIKLNLMGNTGWPDRMFLTPGAPAFIEFKRKNEKPTKLQIYRINYLQTLGYHCMWTDDYEYAYEWLKKLAKNHKKNPK